MKRWMSFLLAAVMVFSLIGASPSARAIDFRVKEAGNDSNGNGRYDIINTKSATGWDIVNEAKKWLGKGATYWSGTTPWPDCVTKRMGFPQSNGSIYFDCSGFVSRVLNDVGLRCNEWSCNYGNALLTQTYGNNYLSSDLSYQCMYGIDIDAQVQKAKNGDWSGMQPGDIITFNSSNRHVLIYAGQNSSGQPMTIEVYGNGNNDCVRYGVLFSNYPQYFLHGARLVGSGDAAQLTISGENYPGDITEGSVFSVKGTISSGSALTSVTVAVYDMNGTFQTGVQNVNPGTTYYDIKASADAKVYFNHLSPGTYRYIVSAKNSAGTSREFVNKTFSVKSNNPEPEKPTNVKITLSSPSISLGDTISITPSASGADHFTMRICYETYGDDTTVFSDFNGFNGTKTYQPTKTGTYIVRVSAVNSAGYWTDAECTFSVVEPAIKITFDAQGGTYPTEKDANIAASKMISTSSSYGNLPVPTKSGYIFGGWGLGSADGDRVYSDTTYRGSTLVAKWLKPEEAGWSVQKKYNGHLYELYEYNLTWQEAKAFCEAHGGHLVVITSKEELKVVTDLITLGDEYIYFIGCTDAQSQGQWRWVNGEQFSYNNWDPQFPEPDPGEGFDYGGIVGRGISPNKQTGEWLANHNRPAEVNTKYWLSNYGFVCEHDSYDPCADGHSYVNGVCERCGARDPNYLAITTQPKSTNTVGSGSVTFTVKASGTGLKYQWQYKAPNGVWKNCSSATQGYNTATLTVLGVSSTTNHNNYQYRCVVTNGSGKSVTSSAATLSVLAVYGQPENASVNGESSAKFSVKVSGSGLKYQWQYKKPNGSWTNCSSATKGYNTATLTVVGYSNGTNRNGYQYRCRVTDSYGKTVTSAAAKLTVNTALKITTQPKSLTAAPGTTAKFTVKATGVGLTYQWQYKTPSGTWKDCTSATTGYRSATLKVAAELKRDHYQYRCIVKDANGKKLTSSIVTLQVQELEIVKQPATYSGKVGTTATFTVQAKGGGLTYQWQYAPAGSTTWKDSTMSGAKTATLKVPVTAARNGQRYRCVITDGAGDSLVTKAVTLKVTG